MGPTTLGRPRSSRTPHQLRAPGDIAFSTAKSGALFEPAGLRERRNHETSRDSDFLRNERRIAKPTDTEGQVETLRHGVDDPVFELEVEGELRMVAGQLGAGDKGTKIAEVHCSFS